MTAGYRTNLILEKNMERVGARARQASAALMIVRDMAIKECLGRWVSELEPVLVYESGNCRFVGLTHAGQTFGGKIHVHVEIKGGEPI